MSFFESIGVAGFLMVIVFAVLLGLYACIKLFSVVLGGSVRDEKMAE